MRPLTLLMKSVGSNVRLKLKDNSIYVGRLIECDEHMNVILQNAQEIIDEEKRIGYGKIFIRGNNILYIIISPGKQ